MSHSVKSIAKALGVSVDEVIAVVQRIRGGRRKVFQNTAISDSEYEEVRSHFGYEPTDVTRNEPANLAQDQSDPAPPVPLAPEDHGQIPCPSMFSGSVKYPIYLHQHCLEGPRDNGQMGKRISLVLQHLAAHGRTSHVKGCVGAGKGWRRSGLGLNGGFQYYLWWVPQGSGPGKELDLPKNGIAVRTIRHHDDHGALPPGDIRDYRPLNKANLVDGELLPNPWTEEQIDFSNGSGQVRVLRGCPGSGKTMALWHAVETHPGERVLYVTWSPTLVTVTEERFNSFVTDDTKVAVVDFARLMGEILGKDVERLSLNESRARFRDALQKLPPSRLGPWSKGNGRDQLFAEVRASVLGRIENWDVSSANATGTLHIDWNRYLQTSDSEEGLGHHAAKAVKRVISALGVQRLEPVFPEIFGAARALTRMREGWIPEQFRELSRVVIDEIQDLTPIEYSAVLQLCREVGRRSENPLRVLIAGDESQTVRPTGFDWGRLNGALAETVGIPAEYVLPECLRCPPRIARTVERASDRYGHLERSLKPGGMVRAHPDSSSDGLCVHVTVDSTDEAWELIDALLQEERVMLVTPEYNPPEWLPDGAEGSVQIPEQAKGLERQIVCVIEPGKFLERMENARNDSSGEPLRKHWYRSAIDRWRVALSRATETLVFIDVAPTSEQAKLSLEAMAEAVPYHYEELIQHLADDGVSNEERASALANDARAHLDENPAHAWRRCVQAFRLLRDSEMAESAASRSVREDVCRVVVSIGALLVSRDTLGPTIRAEASSLAASALRELDQPGGDRAVVAFDKWCAKGSPTPFEFLDAAIELGEPQLLRDAIRSRLQQLRNSVQELTSDPTQAPMYRGRVAQWMRLLEYGVDSARQARALKAQAARTLIEANQLGPAQSVLSSMRPPHHRLQGLLLRKRGEWEESAHEFERGRLPSEAIQSLRMGGLWKEAASRAIGAERQHLEWLDELSGLLGRGPSAGDFQLLPEERAILRKRLNL